jgi:DNA-binding transcriptional ArsR family regulator
MKMDQQLRAEINNLHAQVCGALADPNRILILYFLAEKSRSVNEISEGLEISQPTTSRHLQMLRERNLVSAQREGQHVYYTLKDQRVIQALDLLRAVLADTLREQAALVNTVENTER